MRMRTPSRLLALGICLAIGAAACGRREETAARPPVPAAHPPAAPATPPGAAAPAVAPFRVASIDLGAGVDAGKRVAAPRATFAPGDTIFASVGSEGGAPGATLTARWTYQDGQLVNESSETLTRGGPSFSEFHIAKPSGWPAGRYRVEISANGVPAGTREFEVR